MKKAHGFKWKSETSDYFTYYFELRSPAERDIEEIRITMEKERSKVERLLGAESQQKLDVFLVDSLERMKDLTGFEMHAWANGTAIGAAYGDNGIRRIGSHEILHHLGLKLWGESSGLWINEGLAVYSENHWRGYDLHLLAKWLHDNGHLLPVRTLTANDTWQTSMITYPQCGSFVKFIWEKYGSTVVKDIWQNGVDKACSRMGKSITELEQEWLTELAEIDAGEVEYQVQ